MEFKIIKEKEHTYTSGAIRSDNTDKGRFDLISAYALKRLALVYQRGGVHRGDRNWEKGFPISNAIDSALRHINDYLEGKTVEDNLAHAAWNLFAAMHFEHTMPSMQNIPTRPDFDKMEDVIKDDSLPKKPEFSKIKEYQNEKKS